MAFFTPEMQRLQDEYMETMKTREKLRDMLVTTSREHAVNGFSQDLERFAKTVECAYSIVNQIDLTKNATYQLKTIQEVNRGIHYANTTLKAILAKYNEMQNAVCHQQLLDSMKEKVLPNLCATDYVVLRDLIVALHTEFDSVDSVYLSMWKSILLMKCLGYRETSKQLIQLIEKRISRCEARKSDSRRVPLLRLLHFINANRVRYDRHFACLHEAKSHCSVVDDAVRLNMANRLLASYVPDLAPEDADALTRRHDYNNTCRLSFLQFALLVGPLIKQAEQPEEAQPDEADLEEENCRVGKEDDDDEEDEEEEGRKAAAKR